MNYNKSVALYILYSNAVGLAKAGSSIKKKIKKTKQLDQTIKKNLLKSVNLNTDKYILRLTARHNQLAYGFLRGKSYKSIESQCSPTNRPSSQRITEILQDLLYKYECEKLNVSEASIKKWLGEI